MSPIKNLTESVRIPRLGKIRLGTRDPERGFPRKADHFIFPKDHSDYNKLVELFGEKAKELRIMIPVEEEEVWSSQYYKSYNMTYGLVCKGDGETAMRMVSVETGELPDPKKPGTVTMKEMPCAGVDCPLYKEKKCHEVMNFRFIIPEIPGLGVWQIDTGSKNSILNINSCARLIKRAFGRISMIPLKLTFEPIEVNQPDTGKKQTVYVLNLRTDVTMAQLATVAREQVKMLAVGDYEAAFDSEVEELWGDKLHQITEAEDIAGAELEDKVVQEVIEESASPTEPQPEATESRSTAVDEDIDGIGLSDDNPQQKVAIDLIWLQEQLGILQERGLKEWSNANVISYLNTINGREDKRISVAVGYLSSQEKEKLVAKINAALHPLF